MQQQGNNPINNVMGHAAPPPLVRAGIQSSSMRYVLNKPVIVIDLNKRITFVLTFLIRSNPGSYSSVPISHTPMYNPVNSNASHSNQIRHFYGSQRSSNTSQIQQQQQMVSVPQGQQSYGGQTLQNGNTNGRMTNTQQRNALRNAAALAAPASEIIDLSSPPSSPTPQNDSSRANGNPWDLKRIAERPWGHDTQNNAAYKVNK